MDGVVIGCSGDPGLLEARRMMNVPVAAPLESALHLTALLHQRVAILVADGFEAHVLYRDLARYYGLDHLISEIITVPMSYPEPRRLRQLMLEEPAEASRLILKRHGAVLEEEALELAQGGVEPRSRCGQSRVHVLDRNDARRISCSTRRACD